MIVKRKLKQLTIFMALYFSTLKRCRSKYCLTGYILFLISFSYLGTVSRAVAVGEDALAGVTLGRGVGILFHGASDLVGAILAVAGVSVAEEQLVDTVAVTALEVALGADGLVGLEVGAVHARLGQAVAVLNLVKKQEQK